MERILAETSTENIIRKSSKSNFIIHILLKYNKKTLSKKKKKKNKKKLLYSS
jgi:hypothetical protein